MLILSNHEDCKLAIHMLQATQICYAYLGSLLISQCPWRSTDLLLVHPFWSAMPTQGYWYIISQCPIEVCEPVANTLVIKLALSSTKISQGQNRSQNWGNNSENACSNLIWNMTKHLVKQWRKQPERKQINAELMA